MPASSSLRLPYIALSGVVFGAMLLTFTTLDPLINDINEARNDIQAKQLLLQEKEEYLRSMDRKIAQLNMQTEQEQRLGIILPTDERMEDALRILHEYAIEAGVVINGIRNGSSSAQASVNAAQARGGDATTPEGVGVLAFKIEFMAAYQQLRMFVSALEKSPRLMDTQNITITRNAENPEIVRGAINIRFYTQEP